MAGARNSVWLTVQHLGLAAALVAVSTIGRWALEAVPGVVPFATYFPAILIAALFGGWTGAGAAIVLSISAANFLFVGPAFSLARTTIVVNNGLFILNGLAIAGLGAYARKLLTNTKAHGRRLEALLDEQNHRIKNNLSMVSSLLMLQAKAAPDENSRGELLKAVQRVQNVADIHAHLYRTHARDTIDLQQYLSELCGAFESVVDQDRIRLDYTFSSVIVPMAQALPIGMIVVELITNANKYAYPPPKTGVISISLKQTSDALQLHVGDSGEGLPTEIETKGGVGLRVVRSLTAQLNAEMNIRHHPGASFEIRIPSEFPQTAAS